MDWTAAFGIKRTALVLSWHMVTADTEFALHFRIFFFLYQEEVVKACVLPCRETSVEG